MKKLFSPGISLMNRLKYAQKFALITFLFLLPMSLLMYFFISAVNIQVQFAQKELVGTTYLRPLRGLLEDALRARILVHEHLAGSARSEDITQVQERLSKDMETLAATDRELGATLDTGGKSEAIRKTWRALQEKSSHLDAGVSDVVYGNFIDDIRALISFVGDSSNLILDPDLDSYYTMDTIVVKLPAGQTLLAQAQLLDLSMGEHATLTEEEKAQLFMLTGSAKSNHAELEKELHTALSNNPSRHLAPALEGAIKELSLSTQIFLGRLKSSILSPGKIKLEAGAMEATAQKVFGASFSLWDKAMDELDLLLKQRIQ